MSPVKRKEPAKKERAKKPTQRVVKSRVPLIVGACLLAIIVIACAVFSWMRWARFNDVADIQGVWRIDGSESTITITDTQLVFNQDTKYDYELDSFAKTVAFNLNDLQGEGRYRISDDRQTLAIMDGGDCSWFATMCADAALAWETFWAGLSNQEPPALAEGEGTTILVRAGDWPSAPSEEEGQEGTEASPDEAAAADEPMIITFTQGANQQTEPAPEQQTEPQSQEQPQEQPASEEPQQQSQEPPAQEEPQQ